MTIDYAKIAETLNRMHLTVGIGTEENACTFAALNIALNRGLTDECPDCASKVIWKWGIRIQDAMPDKMRNSQRWKDAAVKVAGTGQAHEKERLAIIMDHMWTVTLPMLQTLADANGFGNEWRRMTIERTPDSARAARAAARVAEAAEAAAEAARAEEASARAEAAEAADAAATAASAAARAEAAEASAEAAWVAVWAVWAEAWAARVARVSWASEAAAALREAEALSIPNAWTILDPCGLLERLVAVGEK
jgi:hypothetical protein